MVDGVGEGVDLSRVLVEGVEGVGEGVEGVGTRLFSPQAILLGPLHGSTDDTSVTDR